LFRLFLPIGRIRNYSSKNQRKKFKKQEEKILKTRGEKPKMKK